MLNYTVTKYKITSIESISNSKIIWQQRLRIVSPREVQFNRLILNLTGILLKFLLKILT